MKLKSLGWNERFEEAFADYKAEGFTAGRVALEHKGMYQLHTENGEKLGEITGSFRFRENSLFWNGKAIKKPALKKSNGEKE